MAGKKPDIFPVFVQRVPAQVEPDQLPLAIQPHDGGPGLALPQLRFINTRSPSRTPTKERGLVLSLLLLPPCRKAEYILHRGQQLSPVLVERIESACLNQALDGAPVADARIDPGGKIEDGGEHAILLPHLHNLVHSGARSEE